LYQILQKANCFNHADKSLIGGEGMVGAKGESTNKMDVWNPEFKFTAGGTGGFTFVDILSVDVISRSN
jgi:hypothetical protein